MKSKQNDFAIGLTAIIVVALFIGTIVFLLPALPTDTEHIVIHFPHESGVAPLKPGASVMLSGAIEVGKVTDVDLEEIPVEAPRGKKFELTIVVQAEIDASVQLYRDCQITTDQPIVGGVGFVVIRSVGTPGLARDADEPIHGLPPQSLGAAVATLSDRLLGKDGMVEKLEILLDAQDERSPMYRVAASLEDINEITADLRAEMRAGDPGTLIAKLHRMLDNVEAMTASLQVQTAAGDDENLLAKLHGALDQIRTLLVSATTMIDESRPPIQATLTSVESISKSLEQELVAALRGELDRNNPDSMLGKIHVSMDRLNASLADIQVITGDSRRLIAANRPAIDRTLENIQDTSAQLQAASAEIRLAPWKLLYRPTEQETAEATWFEAARTFAQAASDLDDAATRLDAVVRASQHEGGDAQAEKEIRAVREAVRAAFERFRQAEEFLWQKMK